MQLTRVRPALLPLHGEAHSRSPLGFILSSEANFTQMTEYEGIFVWDGVKEVLARMWQGVHAVIETFDRSRNTPRQ